VEPENVARRPRPSTYVKIFVLLIVCLGIGFVATQAIIDRNAGLSISGAFSRWLGQLRASKQPSLFEASLENAYRQIIEARPVAGSPNAAARPPSAQELLQMAARNGFSRLDDGTVLSVAKLRADLARRADLAVCASMWSGQDPQSVLNAVGSLPAEEQRQWAEVVARAADAGNSSPIARPAPEQVKLALKRLMGSMPRADAEALGNALRSKTKLPPEDLCRAVRAFYSGLEQADRADTILLMRSTF
jgi:hypothetical protein